ncbi:hypothetical protein EAG11_21235 [Flavobacterium sp. 140616W15]|nr:hypothetical protein EAG11_21235 [Flavobacterium sp. 140616W15]
MREVRLELKTNCPAVVSRSLVIGVADRIAIVNLMVNRTQIKQVHKSKDTDKNRFFNNNK